MSEIVYECYQKYFEKSLELKVECDAKGQLYNYISVASLADISFSVPVLTLNNSGMASVSS